MLSLTRAQQVILAAAVVAIMIGTMSRPRALPVEQLYEEPSGAQIAPRPAVAERQPTAQPAPPSPRPTPQPAHVPSQSAHRSSAQPPTASDRQATPAPSPAPAQTSAFCLVNVNTADVTGLQRLPGIGPKTAEKIILHRQQNGPFRAPQDLLGVKGIGAKKLQDIYPHICF